MATAFCDYKGAGERRCSGLFRECFTLNFPQPHLAHCFCLRFNPHLVWRLTRCLPLAVNCVCPIIYRMVIISSQFTLPIVSKIPCKYAQQEERVGLAPKEQVRGCVTARFNKRLHFWDEGVEQWRRTPSILLWPLSANTWSVHPYAHISHIHTCIHTYMPYTHIALHLHGGI